MKKFLTSLFILSLLLTATIGTVFAQDTTPITGTVKGVTLDTDPVTGDDIVIVSLVDELGAELTVTLSVTAAEALGLVTVDPTTNEVSVAPGVTDMEVSIDPADIIAPADDTEDTTGDHPVGSVLSQAFEDTGVDYDLIMEYQADGYGFGVIAQALWMTEKLEGDAEMFQAILDAKKSGDYSEITLPDGSTPSNWGQFMKAVADGEKRESVGQARKGIYVERVRDLEDQKAQKEDKGNNGNGNSNRPDKDNNGNNGNNGNHGGGNDNGNNGGGNGGGNGNGNGRP